MKNVWEHYKWQVFFVLVVTFLGGCGIGMYVTFNTLDALGKIGEFLGGFSITIAGSVFWWERKTKEDESAFEIKKRFTEFVVFPSSKFFKRIRESHPNFGKNTTRILNLNLDAYLIEHIYEAKESSFLITDDESSYEVHSILIVFEEIAGEILSKKMQDSHSLATIHEPFVEAFENFAIKIIISNYGPNNKTYCDSIKLYERWRVLAQFADQEAKEKAIEAIINSPLGISRRSSS